MNSQFDELTKSMAQSVTRRQALRKFGVGLAGMALACFGLANHAKAAKPCVTDADCKTGEFCTSGGCLSRKGRACNSNSDCGTNQVCWAGTCIHPGIKFP